MIGLLDYDILQGRVFLPYPNLELMKLSAHYREKGIQHELVTNVNMVDSYERVIMRSDLPIAKINKNLVNNPHIELTGLSVSGGTYKSLEPHELEYEVPNVELYKAYLRTKLAEKPKKTSEIGHFLDDSYYRMYAEEEKLIMPHVKRNKDVIIYDEDVFYGDLSDVLQSLANRNCRKIIFKNPVLCHSFDDFLMVISNKKVLGATKFILDFNISEQNAAKLIYSYRNKLKEFIYYATDISMYLGKNYKNNYYGQDFFIKDLKSKLNILYYFWSESIPLKLVLWNRTNPLDNMYDSLLVAISNGIYKMINHRDLTLRACLTQKPIQDSLNNILFFHPSLKNLLNQSYNNLSQNQCWRL